MLDWLKAIGVLGFLGALGGMFSWIMKLRHDSAQRLTEITRRDIQDEIKKVEKKNEDSSLADLVKHANDRADGKG